MFHKIFETLYPQYYMRTTTLYLTSIFLLFAVQSTAFGQSINLTEKLKKHHNETVQQVKEAESADKKRALLNESFNEMITVIERIEGRANLSEDKKAQIKALKSDIVEKQHELNGTGGFEKVADADLDDFSDYSQQYFEQAADSTTITIGVTTLLLIIVILLLI